MSKEDIKNLINEYLTKIGCSGVLFDEPDENTIRALFDATELISFKNEVPGWTHSGIQLDTSGQRKYKIEFKRRT
ncbi:MAG: hypothetical protein HY545_00860 [Candidatus Doudnabacteria bacterium]|nr:hypothetical protein [Candidatus Doudnabacteria bacterium]